MTDLEICNLARVLTNQPVRLIIEQVPENTRLHLPIITRALLGAYAWKFAQETILPESAGLSPDGSFLFRLPASIVRVLSCHRESDKSPQPSALPYSIRLGSLRCSHPAPALRCIVQRDYEDLPEPFAVAVAYRLAAEKAPPPALRAPTTGRSFGLGCSEPQPRRAARRIPISPSSGRTASSSTGGWRC